MSDPLAIPVALGIWCQVAARATARLLLRCQTHFPDGHLDQRMTPDAAVNKLLAEPVETEDVGSVAAGVAASPLLQLGFPTAAPADVDELEQRLARLVLSKWTSVVGNDRDARPDVLAITTRFLTNPEEPYTYHFARFSLLLALRDLHHVSYDVDSLSSLRAAYDRLLGHRERLPEGPDNYERLIIDILGIEGWVRPSSQHEHPERYYQRYILHPLGVPPTPEPIDPDATRTPLRLGDADFSTLINLLFSHPTAIPGLDFVTGGLLAAVPSKKGREGGALVTLISGPPGAGKTSLCLTLGRRMAELGSMVRYITTEEDVNVLRARQVALGDPLEVSLRQLLRPFGPPAKPDFQIHPGSAYRSLRDLVTRLERDFNRGRRPRAVAESPPEPEPSPSDAAGIAETFQLSLVFPRVIIIDSVTALLQGMIGSTADPERVRSARGELGDVLQRFRDLGICVFLAGAEEDRRDQGLSYLVDNVFAIDVESDPKVKHPLLYFSIEKTRLQNTQRERHAFHLAGPDAPSVSPSLHSVLRRLSHDRAVRPDPDSCLEVGLGSDGRVLSIHGRSQVLVYGGGASGKVRFALALALSRRRADASAVTPNASGPGDVDAHLSRTRVLIVSFQYDRRSYEDVTRNLLRQRFGIDQDDLAGLLDVVDFYPGSVDAETVLARVRMRLRLAEVDGRPFTSVILDGVHNVIPHYQRLHEESLLWPTLSRLFRTQGIEAITTFTFFRMPGARRPMGSPPDHTDTVSDLFDSYAVMLEEEKSGRERDFFQLLISGVDYTFLVEPPAVPSQAKMQHLVRITLVNSALHSDEAPPTVLWNSKTFEPLPLNDAATPLPPLYGPPALAAGPASEFTPVRAR